MFLRTLTTIVIIQTAQSYSQNFLKCCPQSEKKCENPRLQTIETQTDFCIDETNKNVYYSNNQTMLALKEDDIFPKCCPIDHFYNTKTHGCIFGPNPDFFQARFIRVGLVRCNFIVDYNYFKEVPDKGSRFWSDKNLQGGYCIDRDESGWFVIRVCESDYGVCGNLRCVRKCCQDGQSFINGTFCRDTYVHGLDMGKFGDYVESREEPFAIIHGGLSPPMYPLSTAKAQLFNLSKTGLFNMMETEKSTGRNISKLYQIGDGGYCIEHASKGTFNNYAFFREFPKEQIDLKFIYTRVAMAISCVFLLLTIIYYCFSKEKRTAFGKTLISYCSVSLLAFLLLSYLSFDLRPATKDVCIVLAFLVFYSTLSSFTWMNVMCIDIYWTFGSSKSISSLQARGKELKRFMWYSLYGWGFPLLLTVVPLLFYHIQVLPDSIQIFINEKKCFVHRGNGNYAQLLFSTAALTILELCNLILFIKTAVYCMKVKREITKMNDTHALKGEKKRKFNQFKDRFGLLIKLFLIMGVSFLFEVVSTFYDFKENQTTTVIEIVWDTFNSLQGLFIFLIFICKRRIFMQFRQKISGFTKFHKVSTSSALTHSTSLPCSYSKN